MAWKASGPPGEGGPEKLTFGGVTEEDSAARDGSQQRRGKHHMDALVQSGDGVQVVPVKGRVISNAPNSAHLPRSVGTSGAHAGWPERVHAINRPAAANLATKCASRPTFRSADAALMGVTVSLSTYCRDGTVVSVAEAGKHRVERTRGSVVGDLARLLLADGADPVLRVHVVDRDTGTPRLMPQRLDRWARTTVTESDADGLRVARWRPGPSERVRQGTVQPQLCPSEGEDTGEAGRALCERLRHERLDAVGPRAEASQ